jgi:hypothetical protein
MGTVHATVQQPLTANQIHFPGADDFWALTLMEFSKVL